jgi:carbonic anhydrase/acetyltransferase-like protein (isoleucine patch superfamily)
MVVTRVERVGDAYVAENASVTGDVTLGEGASVWFGCVLRGDDAPITVGARTNIQDLTMVHADPGVPQDIGEECTIGHGAVLHGARIEPRCLIGMGAILLSDTVIGEGSVVAAGCVVTEGTVLPPRSLVRGVPGKVVREVTDEEYRVWILEAAEEYVRKAALHADGEFL